MSYGLMFLKIVSVTGRLLRLSSTQGGEDLVCPHHEHCLFLATGFSTVHWPHLTRGNSGDLAGDSKKSFSVPRTASDPGFPKGLTYVLRHL